MLLNRKCSLCFFFFIFLSFCLPGSFQYKENNAYVIVLNVLKFVSFARFFKIKTLLIKFCPYTVLIKLLIRIKFLTTLMLSCVH